ncbi:MAG: biotin/lipoyl-binding protein, partial [Burkholderiaceae bacterium]|nr:biotin/lipoyl-binding protein [Burkholderiaceae bacterium]
MTCFLLNASWTRCLIASVLLAGLLACSGESPENTSQTAAARVRIAVVDDAPPAGRRYTGEVRARTESNLGFRVNGKIAQRLVDPGQRVARGQVLMKLDDADLALSTAQAQAAVE